MATRALTDAVDPRAESQRNLLALSFAKSPSEVYPLAVHVAQGAARYAEVEIGKQKLHLVSFVKTPEDAARALALLHYIAGWKTTEVFAGGKLVADGYGVAEVLECYLHASACNDRTAHCHTVIDDPYDAEAADPGGFTVRFAQNASRFSKRVEVDRYLFPCSFLQPRFRFQPDHPASPANQIQAASVKEGCAWCPYFDPAAFKKIGVRAASVPVFE